MPTTTGKASELITFSRTSNATLTDSDGKIKWAPHNLLLASEQFDASNWAKTSGITTITANQAVAPNGTTTADTFNEGTGAGYRLAEQAVSTIASVTYTVGFYAKYISCQWVSLSLYSNSTATTYGAATFDLLNGVVGTSAAAGTGYAVGSPVMEDAGGGWYRCSLTVTNGSSVAANYLAIAASNASTIGNYGLNSYTGTSRTFHLWGAHLYRSDLGAMKSNTSAYPMYNPTTPKNLLGYTEDFSNAGWSKTGFLSFGSGSTVNAISAPNGLLAADLLTLDTANGYHVIYVSGVSFGGGVATHSLYVKPNGYTKVALRENGTAQYYATFSLNGAGSILDNTATYATPAITALDNGWYRISVKITNATSQAFSFWILPESYTTGSPVAMWTANGTSGIYLWGAQLSDSASLDAYVPNYGAAPTAAAYYGPRLDYDPVTLAAKGLLVEELRTNLMLRSEEFGNVSSWTPGNVTISSDAVSAPSGASTADSILETAITDIHRIYEVGATVASGTSYTWSVYVRANGRSIVQLICGATSAVYTAEYDLSAVTTTNRSGTGTATITPVGGGWYRITATAAATASGSGFLQFSLCSAANTTSYLGDITKGAYLWGAQVEAGSFATSYIPVGSTTAGATRSADVASVSTQAFPYGATASSLVAAVSILGSGNGNYIAGLAANSSDNGLLFYQNASSLQISAYVDASVVSIGTATANSVQKLGLAYDGSSNGAVRNGGTVSSVGTTISAAASKLTIGGNFTGGGNFNGHIRQITYLPRRISNAELITRTT
jgi:hypothetical protein